MPKEENSGKKRRTKRMKMERAAKIIKNEKENQLGVDARELPGLNSSVFATPEEEALPPLFGSLDQPIVNIEEPEWLR